MMRRVVVMVLQISAAPDLKEEQKAANNHQVTCSCMNFDTLCISHSWDLYISIIKTLAQGIKSKHKENKFGTLNLCFQKKPRKTFV